MSNYNHFVPFIERQILSLLASGNTIDEAINKLNDLNHEKVEHHVSIIKKEYQKSNNWQSAFSHWFNNSLLSSIDFEKGTDNKIIQLIHEHHIKLEKRVQEIKHQFLLTSWYLLSLLIIFTIVSFIYSIYAFPEIKHIIESMKAEFPKFTSNFIELYPFILFFLVTFVIYLLFVISKIKVLHIYNHHTYLKLPIIQQIITYINEYRHLQKCFLKNESDAGLSNNEKEQLKLAKALGNTFQEMDFILDKKRQLLEKKLFNYIKSLISLCQILILGLICSLLISIYLPIFKLGGTV